MSATTEQKFEELQRAYKELQKQHGAALAELQVRAAVLAQDRGNGLDAITEQEVGRDFGALKTENEELRAAQAAGLEVLQAMVASPGDTQPVFDLIARRAAELCAVPVAAVAMLDGTMLHLATQKGFDPSSTSVYATQFPRPVGPDTVMGRAILSRRVEQIEDVEADPAYGMALALGPRSLMAVPLLRNGKPLGVISVGRPAVGRFPDNLATLLQIFAEQAVIAITSAETYRALQESNVALAERNTEYGERIEQQAATIDVLKVMSASPDDALPVFRLVVERARAFFEAEGASLALLHDGMLHLQAYDGFFRPGYEADFPRQLSRTTMFGRAILARDVVEMPDLSLDPDYYARERPEQVQHAIIAVPLLRAGVPLGAIAIGRRRAGEFSAAEVELLKTFAEQAVIAIGSAETYRALQRRTSDLQESLEHQTATSDILSVISRSTFDLQPVLSRVAETAARLCLADQAAIFLVQGSTARLATNFGFPPEYQAALEQSGALPIPPDSPSAGYRAIAERRVVHIHDVAAVPGYPEASVVLGRQRTSLGIPLLREGEAIGLIMLARQRVEPFIDRQIELVATFADQAAIAIENTRLLTEQREALERQTATAEVLGVINSSPGDLKPVFDAILEKAHSLCGATRGAFVVLHGEEFQVATARGLSDRYIQILREAHQHRTPGDALSPREQLLNGADFVQKSGPAVFIGPIQRAGAELENIHAVLFVPLRQDSKLLGYITAYREHESLFSDKQIAVLQNFAAQAVVAMENARLLNELREALDQQTATAEVLQVINASPGNLVPVFDAVLDKALVLCGSPIGTLATYDGEFFHVSAQRGSPQGFVDLLREPIRPTPGLAMERLVHGETLIHTLDLTADEMYRSGNPRHRALTDQSGARTAVWIALRRDDTLLGMINIYRREVRPFSDKQIALLQNFAAQAVIAMENARLLTEQREALEQQTAMAEVLQVINTSPGNLGPVFDAVLEKAIRLCSSSFGMLSTYDGHIMHVAASYGLTREQEALFPDRPPAAGQPTGRIADGEDIVHLADAREQDGYRAGFGPTRLFVDQVGARTVMWIALRKDQELLGILSIFRREVRPFTSKEIELVQNFAAQAVIAMENARLLGELRQRTSDLQETLEQQTATAEVLQVINASPGELEPVFEAMLERAVRLCDATYGHFRTFDGEGFPLAAIRGDPNLMELHREHMRYFQPGRHNPIFAFMRGERLIHIADAVEIEAYRNDPGWHRLVDTGAVRSVLAVALRKEAALLGYISVYRREVRPFSAREITLMENFAAQAVIAMENARLLNEQREALEQQTATAEVLQVINASPGDLMPVFDAILEKAHNLCAVSHGSLHLFDEGEGRAVAVRGLSDVYASQARQGYRLSDSPATRQLLSGERFAQILDASDEDFPLMRNAAELEGIRTALFVPLRKDSVLLGMIVSSRREVRPFSDKEVALLENFAAQAVIAIENARLLTEQGEALQQQTATAEVLQVINASPGDLVPVFDTILEKAHTLCGATIGALMIHDGNGRFHAVATHDFPEDHAALIRQGVEGGPPHRALMAGERVVHMEDRRALAELQDNAGSRSVVETGVRTGLWVPLRKDNALLGCISAFRLEVRPFSDKEIALLENFAAQAVVAMENARLLNEVRQRQEELRITFENMGDAVAMFDETQHLVAWNGKFQEIFDLPDVLLEQHRTYEEHLHFLADRGYFGTNVDTAEQIHALVVTTGESYGYERTLPDGRAIEIRRNPVPDGGFVLIFSDITERKRSEEEIRAARDAAEAAYRDLKTAQASLIQAEKMASLGQLTAGIAHEIKNPLNFVNNFASLSVDLLEELKRTAAPGLAMLDDTRRAEVDDLASTLASNLGKINEHGRRADGIVRSMLEHSRGSSGERRSVDLNALVDEALNLAYHGARAQDPSFNITLQREFGQNIAPITLAPQDVTRVLLNLFSNGFYAARERAKTMPGFEPSLEVSTAQLDGAAEIRVRDNGIGIPSEIRDRLFQPFFTTKPPGDGTGLGLSMSYDIITQQHGGSISVDSKAGEYSEFTVRLPHNA